MSDQDQSTLALSTPKTMTWETFAVFRETFLANLSPEDAAAYRQMGQRLYFDRIEAFRLEDAPVGVHPTAADLRAAAAYLGFLAGFLASVGEGTELPPSGDSLTTLAHESAAVLVGLEERLSTALDRLTPLTLLPTGDPCSERPC